MVQIVFIYLVLELVLGVGFLSSQSCVPQMTNKSHFNDIMQSQD